MEKTINNPDKISINGQIYDPAEARISPLDQGFMYGVGVFETFRVADGRVFLLNDHFDRLSSSLAVLSQPGLDDRKKYSRWIKEIVEAVNSPGDVRVRFNVTRYNNQTNVVIYAFSVDRLKPFSKKAMVIKNSVRNLPEYFNQTGFRIKSPNYLSANIAKAELSDDDMEGILLSPNGFVAEALTSNIFWTKAGKIYTPPLSLGILPGILRNYLLKTYSIKQQKITAKQLESTDEIFLTNGVNYLMPLDHINKITKPGITGVEYSKLFETIINDVSANSHKLVD